MTIDKTIHQFALASYVQGAIEAYRVSRHGKTPSGAVMEVITDDGVKWIDSFLVVTTRAAIHVAAYKAGYSSTENRIYL